MVEITEQAPVFDEIPGNWLCLDFTHTLDSRYSGNPQEQLKSYNHLIAWGQYVDILNDNEAKRLREEACQYQNAASTALRRAIEVREAIYRLFLAIAEDEQPADADLAVLNAALAETMKHACIVRSDGGFRWDWAGKDGGDAFDVILWEVTRSAADLLTSEYLQDVRACAAEDCRWLFLDTSKNHSRRWCDMKTCGNRAKARRHYERKK